MSGIVGVTCDGFRMHPPHVVDRARSLYRGGMPVRSVAAAVGATAAVLPGAWVSTTPRAGSTAVTCFSRHWTCLFPQHGPGMKHTRPIRLEPWQRAVVDTRPDRFLRGLFHSDGCRTTNRVRAVLADGSVREYSYPRWFFDNTSEDIMRLAEGALDLLRIAHRRARRTCLPVARADAVTELDAAIGPKT